MATLYIIIILLFRVVQAFYNKSSSNEIKNIPMLIGYNAYKHTISATLGLLLIIIAGNGFKINLLTVIIALFSGLSLFASSFCGIYAMKSGTVCLSSIFGTAGMIIPIIAGVLLFNKPVSTMQFVGLVIFFVAVYLLIGASKKIYENFTYKTLLLLIGVLISNGCTMFAQQLFTTYVPDGDVSVFSFISFGIIAIMSAIIYKSSTTTPKAKEENRLNKRLLTCGIALATAVFVINQFATISTKLISPIILFTFINGGGTIISTIVAAIVYKEKISKKSAIGIILGVVSLIIIKAF